MASVCFVSNLGIGWERGKLPASTFASRLAFVVHLGGCQNSDPFWGTLNIRCRILIEIQKGTIILTTIHLNIGGQDFGDKGVGRVHRQQAVDHRERRRVLQK